MEHHHFVLFFTLLFAYMLPSLLAENENTIASMEDYREENTWNANTGAAMEAYNPELLEASLLPESSTPRRDLQGCVASNAIDKCWRCKPDWENNRKALVDCVIGFGKGTTGGAAGEIYVVTDNSDEDGVNPKPGTLRYGAAQEKPLWIIFQHDMSITLKHTLHVTSDKTIDGRGCIVEISYGGGITITDSKNVIIHNVHIHDIVVTPGYGARSACDGDALTIKTCSKIWIDHCTFSKGTDGLLDVTVGSTDVTISNNRFHDHNKVMLLGADDTHTQDVNMRTTVAFNRFDQNCVQRMPRCRFGFAQVVNNDYNKWLMYAIGGSSHPTILSQGNRFVAPDDEKYKDAVERCTTVQESEWKNWNWRTKDDLFENGAIFTASGVDPQLSPEQQAGMIEVAPAATVPELTNAAGVLRCVKGEPC